MRGWGHHLHRFCAAVTVVVLAGACSADEGREDGRSSTPPAPPAADKFTVVASGDVLIHEQLTEQARADAKNGDELDFDPLFAGIRPVVQRADLALSHMETALAPEGGPYEGYPTFNAPPQVAKAVKDTGYDSCSTASNHTLDHGADGVKRTLDTLDEVGLKHTGSARNPTEARKPLIMDVKGVKVAQVSAAYGFNGMQPPKGKEWLVEKLDAKRVRRQAAEARKAGAEVVIASIHWGLEYQHDPTPDQKAIAKELTRGDDIDLVVGHHAHVVQPIEKVNGTWVAYGLGNEVAYMALGKTEEGVTARFTFKRTPDGWTVEPAEYVPTFVELQRPIRLHDLTRTDRYREHRKHIDQVVKGRGGEADGLRRVGA